jgi:hypothetical protein
LPDAWPKLYTDWQTLNITYKPAQETLLATPQTLPTSEPATPQISYTVETIHFPSIHYGYRFGNDSNLNVYTGIDFTYGEYVVEIPKDAELIFNILTRKVPSHWITMPISVYDESIRRAFVDVYGIEGFTLYPATKRSEAISEYQPTAKKAYVELEVEVTDEE